VVISLLTTDPAALGLLLDADFLVLTAGIGIALLRHDVRLAARRAGTSLPVLWCRVGLRLTREQPASLLA
jgi:hypothetical protein